MKLKVVLEPSEEWGYTVYVPSLPAHRPVKKSTLSHILKQARTDLERFLELL